MRAGIFLKSSVFGAACICSANVQTTELIDNLDLAANTDVQTSFQVERLNSWRAFLEGSHMAFAFKAHTWAIGGLVD